MFVPDFVIAIIGFIGFIFIAYMELPTIEKWQKEIQNKPLSWTDQGRVNRS